MTGTGAGSRGPVRRARDGVTVALRVQPRARRNAIGGIATDADGAAAIRVSVTAAPEGGRANDAVIALLARAWGVPKGALSVTAGAAGRRKTVHVAGEPASLEARILRTLTAERDGKHG